MRVWPSARPRREDILYERGFRDGYQRGKADAYAEVERAADRWSDGESDDGDFGFVTFICHGVEHHFNVGDLRQIVSRFVGEKGGK